MNWYPSLFRYAFLISKVFCSNDKVGVIGQNGHIMFWWLSLMESNE